MIEIQGKYNIAKIFTDVADEKSQEQIKTLCDQEFVKDMWGKTMERWEELYSNGAISISQYAEWLIREGKLPSDLNPKTQEAVEAVMKYREQNRIKLSTNSYDVIGNNLENQVIEAQVFFNKI